MKTISVTKAEDSYMVVTRKYDKTKYNPDPATKEPGYTKGDRLVEASYTSEKDKWKPSSWSRTFLVNQETYDALKVGDRINFKMETTTVTTHSITFI